jgi:hypothetical protein
MRILENFMVNIRSLENLKTLSYKYLRRGARARGGQLRGGVIFSCSPL